MGSALQAIERSYSLPWKRFVSVSDKLIIFGAFPAVLREVLADAFTYTCDNLPWVLFDRRNILPSQPESRKDVFENRKTMRMAGWL